MDQLKFFTTAIFARILLKRQIKWIQWIALILLFVGISLVQINNSSEKKNENYNQILGLLTVIVCCKFIYGYRFHSECAFSFRFLSGICSGFAGVYFEKIVKNTDLTLWICNIQLAMVSILTNFVVMYTIDRHRIEKFGIFHDYSSLVWFAVVLDSIGGLIVGLVLKYSDNILKGFASAISIVLACFVAMIFFHFRLSVLFASGSVLVIIATLIYSNAEWILSLSFWKMIQKNKPVFV